APLYFKHGNGYDKDSYETLELATQAMREKHESQILEKQEEMVKEGKYTVLDDARHNAELDFNCSLMEIKESVYDQSIKSVEKMLLSKGCDKEYAVSHAEEITAKHFAEVY
ncbi:thyroid peroxidase-like protein-like protein, partial [Corchorus olitorius]